MALQFESDHTGLADYFCSVLLFLQYNFILFYLSGLMLCSVEIEKMFSLNTPSWETSEKNT